MNTLGHIFAEQRFKDSQNDSSADPSPSNPVQKTGDIGGVWWALASMGPILLQPIPLQNIIRGLAFPSRWVARLRCITFREASG
jgi:hypothetical protein